MAPDPESIYFPSLEKCLNGEQFILPWKAALSAITSRDTNEYDESSAVRQFFADPDVSRLLSKPFDAFPQPSAVTKASLEQKTSAINVTPSPNARFDLKEIKEDVLWLSQAVEVDELSALRIVVVEFQSRTAAQLLGQFSEEELAGIREAAGNSKYSSAIPLSLLSQGVDPEDIKAAFASQEARQQRILGTYLLERRCLLKCVETLLQSVRDFDSQDQINAKGKSLQVAASWVQLLGFEILQKFGSTDGFLARSFAAIQLNVQNVERGSNCFAQGGGKEEVELEWAKSQLSEIIHSMEIVFDMVVSNPEITSSRLILEWLRLVQSCHFFDNLNLEEPTIHSLQLVLRSLTAIISLSILNLGDCLSLLSNADAEVNLHSSGNEPYLFNVETLEQIHAILLNASEDCYTTTGPILLAWSALLQLIRMRVSENMLGDASPNRRGSLDTNQQASAIPYKDLMASIEHAQAEDPVELLALRAVNDCHVFETLSGIAQYLGSTSNAYFSSNLGARMRLVILDLIQHTTAVGYIPEVVEATVSILTGGQNYWDVVDSPKLPEAFDPTVAFFQQQDLVNSLLRNATSRYPYETAPFLQLVRALASSPNGYHTHDQHPVLEYLEPVPIFTYQLPEDFVDYETIQEEDNNNNIRLTHPIQLFRSRTKNLLYETQRSSSALAIVDSDFSIPAGTHGRIISDSGPKVAFWFHSYSALKYFGKLLESFLAAGNVIDATTQMAANRDTVSEIVETFATLLFGTSRSPSTNSTADSMHILETASSGLGRSRDIITVVFEIFEEELQNLSGYSGSDVPLEVLVSCIHFIHAVLPISPRRVWPLLAQSGLLGVGRGGGRLPAIVEGVELVSGRYEFLTSCCRLYDALVEDVVTNTIRRKTGGKTTARYIDGNDLETGVPDQILSKTLLSFTKYWVDVLESSCTWKFVVPDDRRRLTKFITSTFNHVLCYTYGLHVDSTTNSKPLMGTLVPASSIIVESFLSTTSGTLRFQPLLCSYYDGLETPDSTTFLPLTSLWTSHVYAVLSFSNTLLRVSALLDRPVSQLESQIFKSSPLVARLYATNEAYQKPVILLFEALILAASIRTSEPPSLLGHMGPQTSRSFVQVLSDFDTPCSRSQNALAIWHFLSIVISNRQQWFANYLLSGKTPRAALQTSTTGKDLTALERSLLTIVLEKLTNIETHPRSEVLGMLEFVALAQNFWPWTVYGSEKYGEFIQHITEFAGNLLPIQPTKKENALDLGACQQTRIAAYIAEILAMYLFHKRQIGASVDLKSFLPNMTYFCRFAVTVPTYNSSQQGNLRRNFEMQYGGCKLQDFQRSNLENRQLGTEYFYDLSLAEQMLSLDEGWQGARADMGYRYEVALANINLSLVEAQINLFQSWKFLAIELSNKISTDVELQQMLAEVANKCLIANVRSQLPEEVFTSLSQTRADLALVLTQRLVQVRSNVSETKTLLTNVWQNIRSLRDSFDRALQGSELSYYRSLLKLLFLSLRIHASAPPASHDLRASLRISQSAAIIPLLLEILKLVVAQGLRELASSIHESAEESTPEDLSLLTGILQTILHIPGVELCYQQIVTIFASQSTARIATTLFSWSDSLAINGDPIYGELSMLFLLELSTIPLMAEQLAIDGVLGHLAAANITSYLRRGNVGPFADSAGLQRCYSIWVRGVLPLLLNLLDSVQVSIAGEVALFLSQFPSLLNQSSIAFESPETNRLLAKGQAKFITLSTCSEVHSLALLTHILNQFRQGNGGGEIVEVTWDAASVGENVEFWLGSRALLRERIVAMGEREVEWSRKKAADGVMGTLEEKVLAELLGTRDVLGAGD